GQRVRARHLREDGGQQMAVAAAISEARSRFGYHWLVQHELHPIGAAAHLGKPSLRRLESAVPARLHCAEMFPRELVAARVESRPTSAGKAVVQSELEVSPAPRATPATRKISGPEQPTRRRSVLGIGSRFFKPALLIPNTPWNGRAYSRRSGGARFQAPHAGASRY